jgi:hypothetical protein
MANTSVFGIYPTRADVSNGMEALRNAGFRNTDISALFPENLGTKDFAHEKNTKAPEGAAAGGTCGALLGGTFGWLVGIGALAIPALAPFLGGGPIVVSLAGVGVGAVAGGLVGALLGLGMPEYEAKRYEGRIKGSGVLISVHCDNSDWVRRARQIMQHTGASEMSSAGEASADFSKSERPLPRSVAPKGL